MLFYVHVCCAVSKVPEGPVAPVRGEHWMSEEEQDYIGNLIKKYGEDYKKMFRDTKLNFRQLTQARLQRRCERYRLLQRGAL